MADKEVLKRLIDALDEFERGPGKADPGNLAAFGRFLSGTAAPVDTGTEFPGPLARMRGPENTWVSEQYGSAVNEMPVLVALMYRYARHYVKKAMKDSKLQTMEEFGFLIALLSRESMTKSELFQAAVLEKTTGTEVIRRLLKLGLLREFPDPDDKRSVRVALTDMGKAVVFQLLPQMDTVSKIVAGNLVPSEIDQLYHLLKKLDAHHNDLYLYRRNAALDDLL